MPAAIPAIAGAIAAKAVGGGIFGAIVGSVVSAGVGALLQKNQDAPDFSFEDQARGINANIANPVAPIPVVYGTYRFAGSRVYTGVGGANNKYLYLVISFSEGEIEEFTDVYLDDVSVTDSRFSGLVSFGDGQNAHLGTDAQTADSVAVSAITDWTTDHRLRGVSYLYMRLTYDPEVFSRIPVVSATVKGKKVVDVVAGGSPVWSDNPANCIYDYLTNTRYGRGIPASEIDVSSFQTAHAICAALISNSPEPSQATYTCDGLINIDRPTLDNLRDLLTSCRGYLTFTGGQYRLIVDQAESSAFAFTESNIVGQMKISLDSKSARFNRVRAQYYNADKNHQPDLVISDSPTYRTADNGTLLERAIELPFTTDVFRARRIAELELKQSRYTIGIEFNSTLEGLRAEVGDVVTITHATPGWTLKKFRVMEIGFDSEDRVNIIAREYQDIYTPSTPPAAVTPPTITFPPVNDILNERTEEPAISWLYSFENGDIEGWVNDDGSITTTSDSCVGDVAGIVTHGGGGETSSASIEIPDSFAANVLSIVDNQVRLQLWAKQPSAGAASGFKARLVGSSENSGWHSFTTSTSCQAFGFVWKPTTAQTSLTLEIEGDSSDTGTASTIIDNVLLYKLPDFINASNIGTWLGTVAIGSAYIADLAVTTGKIADLAVTSAKVTALDAAKITTGTLDANRIGANTITATHITTGTITVTEIAPDAVTTTDTFVNNSAIDVGTSFVNIGSVTISTISKPVEMFASFNIKRKSTPVTTFDDYFTVEVRRGSTVLYTVEHVKLERDLSTSIITTVPFSKTVIDETPGTGSVTYYMYVKESGTGVRTLSASYRQMMSHEVKR